MLRVSPFFFNPDPKKPTSHTLSIAIISINFFLFNLIEIELILIEFELLFSVLIKQKKRMKEFGSFCFILSMDRMEKQVK